MTRYEPRIDTASIRALDMHTHVEADHHGHFSLDQELMDASAAYFRGDHPRTPTVDDLAAYYRERD
ncbi:MAG TPA: 4-hydroxyphenyl-beta-ketoacyl-CoA hydrolase, partial [Nocardioides sp.]